MWWKRNTLWGLHAASVALLTGMLATATSTVGIGQEAKPEVRRDGESPAPNVPVRKDLLGGPLPPGAIARFGTTRLQQPSSITSVMYARDGKSVFSTGSDRTIRVWDVATGQELAPFQGECSHPPVACQLSPDGKFIAGSGYRKGLRSGPNSILFWDVTSRSPHDPIPIEGKYIASVLAFSPNGKFLATCCTDDKVRIWDLAARQEVRQLPAEARNVHGMSFSPDGTRLVSCGNNPVFESEDTPLVLWDVASGERLWQIQGPRGLASVMFLADGKTIAAGAVEPGSVTLYDAATGAQKAVLRPGGRRLTLSPDGKILAIVCTPTAAEVPGGYQDFSVICLWDLARGKALRTLVGHPGAITGLAFSPDGKTLASGGGGGLGGLIVFWDVATGKRLHPQPGHALAVLDVAFAPDGKTVASRGDEQTVRLWDPATGKEGRSIPTLSGRRHVPSELGRTNFPGLSYSPDGKAIAAPIAWGNSVGLWDADSGRQLLEFKGHRIWVNCVAFAPDGKSVASGDMHGIVRVFDPITGGERHCLDFQPPGIRSRFHIDSLAFSPDSRTLAVGSSGITIHLWDVKTGTRLPTQFRALALGMAFCEEGRLLAAGQRTHSQESFDAPVIRLLDVSSGAVPHTLKGHDKGRPGHGDITLAVSPDGQLLASGSNDQTVRVWELATRQEMLRFEGHRAGVGALAFAPDGKRLVSGSRDTTAIVWNLLMPTSDGRPVPASTPDAKELQRLWDDLAAAEARRAHAASARLDRFPNEALQLLREHLRPLPEVTPDFVQAIKDLDDADFNVREAATATLRRVGLHLRPELERALAKPSSAEARRRLKDVLEEMGSTPPPSDVLRQKRAVRLLEWIGTAEAQRLLETLAKGRDTADQTLDARAAVRRLSEAQRSLE